MTHFMVDGLQTCEPDLLVRDLKYGIGVGVPDDVRLTIDWTDDDMGFPTSEVRSTDLQSLLNFVREHWGDSDAEWFDRYVVRRVLTIDGDLPPKPRLSNVKHLGPIDSTSETFLTLVEDGFYYATKGDISLVRDTDPEGYDEDLRDTVDLMARSSFQMVDTEEWDQWSAFDNESCAPDWAEVAYRIVQSLIILWWGSLNPPDGHLVGDNATVTGRSES